MSDEPDHYSVVYRNFQDELYAEIRRESFDKDIGQNNWSSAEEHRRLLGWLELAPSDRVLDVACGSGGPTLYMARLSNSAFVGVDNNPQAVAHARALALGAGLGERLRFMQHDAGDPLPFPAGHFGAVVCLDAVNHFADRALATAEWARLLRPGGRVLLTDCITVTGLISAAEVAARSGIGHYVFAPLGEVERMLAAAGLTVVRREDVTGAMAEVAGRRLRARAARVARLRRLEGDAQYERHQALLQMTERLALERRLSRLVYLAERRARA